MLSSIQPPSKQSMLPVHPFFLCLPPQCRRPFDKPVHIQWFGCLGHPGLRGPPRTTGYWSQTWLHPWSPTVGMELKRRNEIRKENMTTYVSCFPRIIGRWAFHSESFHCFSKFTSSLGYNLEILWQRSISYRGKRQHSDVISLVRSQVLDGDEIGASDHLLLPLYASMQHMRAHF